LLSAIGCGWRLLMDLFFMEPSDFLFTPYFTVASIRYVLTLDSCPFEYGSAAQLFVRLDHRTTDAWPILSNQTVNTFSERFRLRKVLDIAPASPSSADLQLALYSAHLRPDQNASPPRSEGFERR
jgi:hypothetical protein